jgi:hypothetical protein
MPVTRSRNGMHEMLALDQTNTARFLFGEDEGATSPDVKNYLQMNATDDKFPILVRRDEYPGVVDLPNSPFMYLADRHMQLSASSAALDLALSSPQAPDANGNGWGAFGRHRPSQPSLPMNSIQGNGSPSVTQSNGPESPISVRPTHRHSLDLKYFGDGPLDNYSQVPSPSKHSQATPPKLQSSYSANDVPTMRSTTNGSGINNTPNSHAQQHLHNHNASLGRIPPNAMNNRLSREMSSGDAPTLRDSQNGGYQSIQSALHASAPPFGPSLTQSMTQAQISPSITSPTSQQQYPITGYYNSNNANSSYNMQMMTMGMQNMQMGQPMYSAHNPYAAYPNMYPQAGGRDSQARVIQQRRQNDGEGKSMDPPTFQLC